MSYVRRTSFDPGPGNWKQREREREEKFTLPSTLMHSFPPLHETAPSNYIVSITRCVISALCVFHSTHSQHHRLDWVVVLLDLLPGIQYLLPCCPVVVVGGGGVLFCFCFCFINLDLSDRILEMLVRRLVLHLILQVRERIRMVMLMLTTRNQPLISSGRNG